MPYWRLYYHVVWGTKHREPLIDDGREDIVRRSLRATCEERGALVHGIGVMPDHVHVAVSIPPRHAVSDFVHRLKGSSSHLVNHLEGTTGQRSFAWQAEYGVLSHGERSLPDVVAYVENQRTRHAGDHVCPSFEQSERPYDPTTRPRS